MSTVNTALGRIRLFGVGLLPATRASEENRGFGIARTRKWSAFNRVCLCIDVLPPPGFTIGRFSACTTLQTNIDVNRSHQQRGAMLQLHNSSPASGSLSSHTASSSLSTYILHNGLPILKKTDVLTRRIQIRDEKHTHAMVLAYRPETKEAHMMTGSFSAPTLMCPDTMFASETGK